MITAAEFKGHLVVMYTELAQETLSPLWPNDQPCSIDTLKVTIENSINKFELTVST